MKNRQSSRTQYGRVASLIPMSLLLIASFSHPAFAFKTGESASLVIGQSSFMTNTCSTAQSQLCFPAASAFDSSGDLWVVDGSNSRVLEFKPPFSNGQSAVLVIGQTRFTAGGCSGGFIVSATQSGLCNPLGLAFDSSGDLWVSDTLNSRVLRFSPPFSNGEDASMVIGQPDFTANAATCTPPTQSGLCKPGSVAFDSSGNLWVVDTFDNRVLQFSPLFSNGESASLVIGQSSFTTSDCSFPSYPGPDRLCNPVSLAFDSSGDLWVSDGVDRVLQFVPPFSDGESASIVIGQPNFTTLGCSGLQNQICSPGGLAFDSEGNLWVADAALSRVLEFASLFSNGENASLVIGQSSFGTITFCSTTQSGLCNPRGVAFDPKGNLWVDDTSNSRVLAFAHHGHHVRE